MGGAGETMPFDAIYMTHVPGAAAMVFLVGLVVLLRKRSPRLQAGVWLVTTGFIMAAQLGWFLNGAGDVLRMHLAHSMILLGQMLTGVALLFYGPGPDRRWMVWNTAPLMVFVTLFGFYVDRPAPYLWVGMGGLVLVAGSSWWRGIRWKVAVLGMIPLAPAIAFAGLGWYRMAGYWVLAAVHGLAWVHLRRVLPGSTPAGRAVGRLPMLVSVALWAVVYGTHAWVIHHEFWRGFAEEVWGLLKYLLVIGMLLVLLEDQVSENQHLASHDALTGLPNRRTLLEWLEGSIGRARREGGRVTVVLVDLNGFKKVNDTYGHLAGDYLLMTVARRMREVADPRDLLVRLGGDEFVLASRRELDVEALEERLGQAIGEPVEMEGRPLYVAGSFGVAVFPDDVAEEAVEGTRSALLRVADERMYASKAKG